MPVEAATYLHNLAPANPPGTDPWGEGDNHLRLLKDVAQKSFPSQTTATGLVALTAGGTANALTIAPASTPAAYVDGLRYTVKATAANTGAVTLKVGSLA